MICFPNAKINLGLSVENRRSDGFHNINTCIIPIPIYDILEIRKAKEYSLKVLGKEKGTNIKNNIIDKAWNMIKDICPEKVEVLLYKNIPIGSGLGGGSSDATFFVIETLKLFNIKISSTKLIEILFRIGSDCPFFIKNTAALVTGAGEKIISIENPIKENWLTLIYPDINISTAKAFEEIKHFDTINFEELLYENKINWKNQLTNSFLDIAIKKHPNIKTIIELLYNSGAYYVSLSGTGSAVFALSVNRLELQNSEYRTFSAKI